MSRKPRKPWTKEAAENRYVQGDRISLVDLAKVSGLPLGNIRMWCDKEEWVNRRSEYQIHLRSRTHEKTIEKTSDRLSDEFSDIASTNYKAHKLFRDYVLGILQIKARHLQKIQKLPEDEQNKAVEEQHKSHVMNFWNQMLARSTEGISAATGLNYHIDVNASARRIEKEGLIISNPLDYEEEENE